MQINSDYLHSSIHIIFVLFLQPFQGSSYTEVALFWLCACFTEVQNTKYYLISYFIILLFDTQCIDFICKVIPSYDDNP